MIPQTSIELLKAVTLVTDQSLHKEAFKEYKKLQSGDKTTKFRLKKIYHESGNRTYVWQMGRYFTIERLEGNSDNWSLNETSELQQTEMPL